MLTILLLIRLCLVLNTQNSYSPYFIKQIKSVNIYFVLMHKKFPRNFAQNYNYFIAHFLHSFISIHFI